jgi:hypothetical protein
MKLLTWLRTHCSYHREAYVVAPLAFLGLWLSILFVGTLTGRDVTEDLGSLVACMVALAKLSLMCLFIGTIQKHFYGYRSEKPGPHFRDDVFDAVVTSFLFLTIGYVVFFL